MKERLILFQGDMVRALLNDTKTQTRRIVKPQPILQGVESFGDSWKWSKGDDSFSGVTTEQLTGRAGLLYGNRCPYQVGNRLWVKETFLNNAHHGYEPVYFYRADDENKPHDRNWKPSIFMPRSASRITLEIVEVRVQRVQEISEEDAIAEGCKDWMEPHKPGGLTAKVLYSKLWESINAKRGYPWSANPFVWAITFKRI